MRAASSSLEVVQTFGIAASSSCCSCNHASSAFSTPLRRIVPISENLAAWLAPRVGTGPVLLTNEIYREVTALATRLNIEWPRNVLRHSFISYRLPIVKSAEQVALEAGNSPTIIFKHYRELATEEDAHDWFRIAPQAD